MKFIFVLFLCTFAINSFGQKRHILKNVDTTQLLKVRIRAYTKDVVCSGNFNKYAKIIALKTKGKTERPNSLYSEVQTLDSLLVHSH